MSPKVAEPAVRAALVDAAARLLADEGPSALTTRRVAAGVGVSTMAVYTHFGGKEDLIRAVVWEGFERLAAHLQTVKRTRDPVADLLRLGIAYRRHAITAPHLYVVMFGGHSIADYSPTAEDRAHGLSTFTQLVAAVQRGMDAARFTAGDATAAAVRVWAMVHGAVTLELADFLDTLAEPEELFRAIGLAAAVSLGDDPEAARRSLKRAVTAP